MPTPSSALSSHPTTLDTQNIVGSEEKTSQPIPIMSDSSSSSSLPLGAEASSKWTLHSDAASASGLARSVDSYESAESDSEQSRASESLSSKQSSPSLTPTDSSSSQTASTPSTFAPAEWEVASKPVLPSYSSSFFRPFSKFVGTQSSDRQTYSVEVELKHVDMEDSFACGYLKIEGLTERMPTITTYFESEIIGTKYGFHTRHPGWGATERTDLDHWSRFRAFAPLKPAVKAHSHHDPEFANRDFLFMRWKEQFLVPDYKKSDLPGASFEGFYYIVLDQRTGALSGIYFHSKSPKFQRLELQYEPQMWTSAAVQFR